MQFFKLLISYFIALFIHAKYKNTWLIGERGVDARDNAFWLYKYICEEKNKQDIYYLIDSNSPDFKKIKKIGKYVIPNTIKHGILFFSSSTLISTHAYLCCPKWKGAHFLLRNKIFNKHEKHIYIQHGLVKDYLPDLTYPTLDVDLYTAGALPEYNFLCEKFNFPDNVVKYTGLARYDNLWRHKNQNSKTNENFVLVMPTWRHYLEKCDSLDSFKKSEFFQVFSSFLSNNEILNTLKKFNLKIIFYPHYEMQKWIKAFENFENEFIIVAKFANYDVQDLLMNCDFLVTDYSSVFFDIAYMRKPVIFYQFDEQLFRDTQYQEGYFKYEDSFGPVCYNEVDLINEFNQITQNGISKNFLDNEKNFFEKNDDRCCERIYDAILSAKIHR